MFEEERIFFFKISHAQKDWVAVILFFIASGFLVPQQVVEGIGTKSEGQGNFEHQIYY